MPGSRRLIWLPGAVADLTRLREFIRVHNPAAAHNAGKRLLEAARTLTTQPFIGRPAIDVDTPQFRDLFIAFGQNGYWMRYTVTDEAIFIVRIWHGRESRIWSRDG
jgi:plasmid stabilization system protein ParE